MAVLRCPFCGRSFESTESVSLPFCSPRCRSVDLNRWLSEDYGLPEDRLDEDEEADEQPPSDQDEADA
jgi:uncharacterized protein